MNNYIYKLKDDSGKVLFGFLEAQDKRDLKRKLRHSSYYFVSAYPYPRERVFRKKVDLEALLTFTHRLSSLIESGIPILTAMHILWRQTEDKTLQLVISHIRRNLEAGNKISEALDDFPHIFPKMYRSLIAIAEKAGGLVLILKRLTAYLQYQKNIITRVKKATLYPSIVVVFAMLVLLAMFIFVVPIFQKVLVKLKIGELPALTQFILGISQVLKSPYFLTAVLVLGVIAFIVYKQMRRNPRFSYQVDDLKLKIPFFGHILYTVSLSRFIHSLSILIGAGLPILESFDVARSTAVNQKIDGGINAVQKQIEQGGSLYSSFKEIKMFPVMLIEMVGVGEASGTIVKVLENLALHFDDEVDYNLNKFLTILEPFLIIFVGAIVILTLLAIYLPIFSIWQGLTG